MLQFEEKNQLTIETSVFNDMKTFSKEKNKKLTEQIQNKTTFGSNKLKLNLGKNNNNY